VTHTNDGFVIIDGFAAFGDDLKVCPSLLVFRPLAFQASSSRNFV
jgi:hypothetical protein